MSKRTLEKLLLASLRCMSSTKGHYCITLSLCFVDANFSNPLCRRFNRLSTCTFNYMTHLMSHVVCLNNTRE